MDGQAAGTEAPLRGFVYYLPGKGAVGSRDISAAGLDYAADGGGPLFVAVTSGPDRGPGAAFTFPGPDGRHPDVTSLFAAASWSQIPGSPAWLGVNPKEAPGPDELARREQVAGHQARLSDGREWLVPAARLIDGGTRLPRRLAWDGRQWTPGTVLARYAELFADACRLWEALVEDGRVSLSDECDVAARALAVNYRLGPAEISALGLFDTESEGRAVMALIDFPALEACKKKLESAPVSPTPGGGA